MTSISFYLGMHRSVHNFLGINKQVEKPYQIILTVLILHILLNFFILEQCPITSSIYLTYMRHDTGCAVNLGVPEAYL